ncbi:MAG: FmdB family zinc ribbon protein [Acidobacteriota bacterium]
MPLYEYECSKCHKKIEIIQKVGEPPPKKCPYCGGILNKLVSTPAIQFKGSGWYVTDYARNNRNLHASPSSKNQKNGASAVPHHSKKNKSGPIKTQNKR